MQNSPPDPCQKFRLLNNLKLLISFSIVLIDFLILRFYWHDLSMRFTKFCNKKKYHVLWRILPNFTHNSGVPGGVTRWLEAVGASYTGEQTAVLRVEVSLRGGPSRDRGHVPDCQQSPLSRREGILTPICHVVMRS